MVAVHATVSSMWHIAQVNVARPVAPFGSAQLADFVALLEPVNTLADGEGCPYRVRFGALAAPTI
jgi:hypothetical protein